MRELILTIAKAEEHDQSFGRVKLAKLLYYMDNEAYLRLGQPITGATYQKLKDGPAAREFLALREEMLTNGEATETALEWPNGLKSFRLVAMREPKSAVLSEGESAVIARVLRRFKGVGGGAISKQSHEEIGWRVAPAGGTIPYPAYLLAPKVTERQRAFARKKAVSLGLT